MRFSETVEIREYEVEELPDVEADGPAPDASDPEPASAATPGRKRGRPALSKEQKVERLVEAAERKGESAEEAWLKKLEEKLEGGGLYDEPSVVARWKERMIAQADKVCELQVDALTKRHAFEEWRVEMTELRAKLEVHQERLQHTKEDHQRAREDLVLLGLQRRIAGMRLEKEKLTIKMDTLKAAHAAEDRGHALRERDLRLREEHVERMERLVREDHMHDLMLRGII